MVEEPDGSYRTVAGRGEHAFTVRGSEFVGLATHARTVEAADEFVREVRKAHPEATHTVPAYRVRVDDGGLIREYERDEEEPTGSAGKPALNVLRHRELQDVVVVISRYFGGSKLGVGRLARAYARASNRAIDDTDVVETVPHERLSITVEYDDSGTIRGTLESEGLDFEAEYAERVHFEASIPREETERVLDRLRSATSGRVVTESWSES